MKPKGTLECWRRVMFLAVGDHDHRVDVEHDNLAQLGVGDLAGGQPIGQYRPHVAAHPRPRRLADIDDRSAVHDPG